jgi:hypothetical protein
MPAPPPTPPPPNVVDRGPRPTTVTAGGVIVLVLAGLSVVSFLLMLANLDALVTESVRQAKTGDNVPQNIESIVRATVIGAGVFGLVLAAVVSVFALLTLRGRNWARITVVVLTILWAVFSFIGLAGSLVSPQENLPGGYTATSMIIAALQFLGAAAAAVLLLLPASRAWFDRR